MEFTNEALDTQFTLSQPFTARMHETWETKRFEVMRAGAKANLTVNWLAATVVIKEWDCKLIPSLDPFKTPDGNEQPGSNATLEAALDLGDAQIAVMSWVGTIVHRYIVGLLTVPKALS